MLTRCQLWIHWFSTNYQTVLWVIKIFSVLKSFQYFIHHYLDLLMLCLVSALCVWSFWTFVLTLVEGKKMKNKRKLRKFPVTTFCPCCESRNGDWSPQGLVFKKDFGPHAEKIQMFGDDCSNNQPQAHKSWKQRLQRRTASEEAAMAEPGLWGFTVWRLATNQTTQENILKPRRSMCPFLKPLQAPGSSCGWAASFCSEAQKSSCSRQRFKSCDPFLRVFPLLSANFQ